MIPSSVLFMALAVACGYLLGSVSFAVVVSRLFGLTDPRAHGSGNPGATNVLRTGNKTAAVLTLLGDALKGALAIGLARLLGQGYGFDATDAAAVGLAAFAGHLYPVFFKFKGGKGVATFLGVALALDWNLGIGCCAVWVVVALIWRFSSLASILASMVAPILWVSIGPRGPGVVFLTLMTALVLWRHRTNINGLLSGTERRIGQGSSG
jgi:glycerol-3-phosphate acyltransferase PlsY